MLGIANLTVSLGLTVLSPVWSLGGAVTHYLVDQLIYDFDSSERSWFPLLRILIWDFLIQGVAQTVVSPVVAVGHAIAGGVSTMWNVFRYCSRSMWDFLMYHLIVKWKGRVPERNGFLARRTKGPGISMEYYQIVDGDFAILMLQYELEMLYLERYKTRVRERIDIPLKELCEFHDQFLKVGLQSDSRSEIIKEFERVNQECYKKLRNVIENHLKRFLIRGNICGNHVRLTRNDLERVIKVSELLCEEFFHQMIHPILTPSEIDEFWKKRQLVVSDFKALSTRLLCKVMGNSILQPIEDTDPSGFRLIVEHLDTHQFIRGLFKNQQRLDDLDTVNYREGVLPAQDDNVYPLSEIQVITPENYVFDRRTEERYVFLE